MSLTKVSFSMINGDVVNVLDYGADLTGVADSTSAIAAAIATGKAVFFPKGTYLSGAQTVTTQGQTFFGEGAGSIIQASSASASLFTVQASYVTFTDLRMNGASTSDATISYAIFTDQANPALFLTAERLLITGASAPFGFNDGIKLDNGCTYSNIINCHFDRLWGAISGTGYGVLCAGNRAKIISCNFFGSSGRGRHAVYITAGASDCIVSENSVDGFDFDGITQYAIGAQSSCDRNIYSSNIVTNCVSGGNVTSGAIGIFGYTDSALIIGNTITGSSAKGIVVDGTGVITNKNTVITGNIVNYSALIGIDLIACVGGAITCNKVFESSTTSAGTYSNIRLVSDGTTATSDIIVTGNHSAGATYARSAFQLNSTAPTPSNVAAYGNQFDLCNLTSVELNGVVCPIDSRLMFRQDSVTYGPITSGSYVTANYTITGANTGDICTVSHTAMPAGCVIYANCNSGNTVTVTVTNVTGSPVTTSSGSLRIDVWRRPANYL